MSCQDLMKYIEEYNEQLSQVSLSLQERGLAPPDKHKLEELQQNLLQVLELSLEQLEQQQQLDSRQQQQHHTQQSKCQKYNQPEKTEDEIRLEEELALFKAEISELESETDKCTTIDNRENNTEEDSSANLTTNISKTDGSDVRNRREKEEYYYTDSSSSVLHKADNYDFRNGKIVERDGMDQQKPDGSEKSGRGKSRDQRNAEEYEEESADTIAELLQQRNTSSGHAGFVKAWTAEEVQRLEGAEVRAPFTELWGGHSYHNAIVMSVGSPTTGELDLSCPEVVVLFREPTCPAMLPCKFFLSGSCHYMDGSCQYSHGSIVLVQDLRPYTVPESCDVSSGSRVLCQHETQPPPSQLNSSRRRSNNKQAGLWHQGTVEDVLAAQDLASVMCSVCKVVIQCEIRNLVMLSDDHDTEKSEELGSPAPEALVVQPLDSSSDAAVAQQQHWLLAPSQQTTGKLGQWEKHTKGIGSRLMLKMGYIAGAGLGKDGKGRVEPVPAYLYPAGVSLDRCMELRERSGGEDMLQVEKRLQKQQQKQEHRIQREEQKLSSQTSVFDIINNKLAGAGGEVPKSQNKSSSSDGASDALNVCRQHLQKDTSKTLNMKGYQLGTRVRTLEKEVQQLVQSRDRQRELIRSGKPGQCDATVAKIEANLKQKQLELKDVRTAEDRVYSEQSTRREKKKYVVF